MNDIQTAGITRSTGSNIFFPLRRHPKLQLFTVDTKLVQLMRFYYAMNALLCLKKENKEKARFLLFNGNWLSITKSDVMHSIVRRNWFKMCLRFFWLNLMAWSEETKLMVKKVSRRNIDNGFYFYFCFCVIDDNFTGSHADDILENSHIWKFGG